MQVAGKARFVGAYEQLRAALANDDLAAAKAAAGKLAAADGASAGVVATQIDSAAASGASRSTVDCRSDRPPSSDRSCFGRERREAGQNRVPDPPASTSAVSDMGGKV